MSGSPGPGQINTSKSQEGTKAYGSIVQSCSLSCQIQYTVGKTWASIYDYDFILITECINDYDNYY